MSELTYLAFLPDHFDLGTSRFLIQNADDEPTEIALKALGDVSGYVVTHDAAQLIEEARREGATLPLVIDLASALKLASGLSRDQGGEASWDIWRAVKPFASQSEAWEDFRALSDGRKQVANDEDALAILLNAATAIAAFWPHFQKTLKDEGEFDRFWQVEVPVQQIFHQRQLKGIAVDVAALDEIIQATTARKYEAYLRVAETLRQSPSALTFRDIGPFLSETDAAFLSEFADAPNLEDYFRLAQDTSSFARDFLELSRCGRDLSSLHQIASGGDRVFPTFSVMGTVTGRVLVSHPYIQELRRSHRGMLVADEGKRIVYLDYGQFEPAILAVLAGDKGLIDLYNEADLYEALAETLFGDATLRPTAKRMFLAFCYGMSQENIARLAVGSNTADVQGLRARAEAFFGQFPALVQFRGELHNRLFKFGRIQTMLGNHRRRTSQGPLTAKEKRWAISQAVQGSASLIFKEALIDLEAEFGADSILLPMHDAILLQFTDDDLFDDRQSQAVAIMAETVGRRCPEVTAKVAVAGFAQ